MIERLAMGVLDALDSFERENPRAAFALYVALAVAALLVVGVVEGTA